jgi:hypothetical protein
VLPLQDGKVKLAEIGDISAKIKALTQTCTSGHCVLQYQALTMKENCQISSFKISLFKQQIDLFSLKKCIFYFY